MFHKSVYGNVLSFWMIVGCVVPRISMAQSPQITYFPETVVTQEEGRDLITIEEQTKAVLDRLGHDLSVKGLGYRDVVVSNVFLKDTRDFQAMNAICCAYFDIDAPTRATVQVDLLDPKALIQISAVAAAGPKKIIIPANLKSPELPYSWGISVGNTLFISGATSRSPETYQPVPGDVGTQTRRVLGNIGLILDEAGMDFSDLVSCKVFLDDTRDFQAMNAAYIEFMPVDDPPARATVRAGLVNKVFSSEIQCIAEKSDQRRMISPTIPTRRRPFSPAIDSGDKLYVAGIVVGAENAITETQAAMTRIESILGAGSRNLESIENMWIYLTDIRDAGDVLETLHGILGPDMPEPTIIGAPLMGRAKVEIQVVAGNSVGSSEQLERETASPILDVHVHAHSDVPNRSYCPNSGLIGLETEDGESLCSTPLRPAQNGKDLMERTLRYLEDYNMYAIAMTQDYSQLEKWTERSHRILPSIQTGIADFEKNEVQHLVESGKVIAIGELMTQYEGISPDSEEIEKVWDLAVAEDVPVGIHMSAPGAQLPNYVARYGNPLLLEPVLKKYPELRIYLMHAGWPFLEETVSVLRQYPNVYVDISFIDWQMPINLFHNYLRQLVDYGFGKRIMFGSDQSWPDAIQIAVENVEAADFLSSDQKDDIFFENALRFFRIDEDRLGIH
ncbi:MAG: Rid family hydrolase [bacterium]